MVTWNVATRHPEEDLAEMLGFGTSGKQKVQERLPDFFAIGWEKIFPGYYKKCQSGKNRVISLFIMYQQTVTVLEGSDWNKQHSEQDTQNTRIPMLMEGWVANS